MAPARTYEESRKVVCFLCMKKVNRVLTDTFKHNFLEVLQVSNNFSDTRVPFGCLTGIWSQRENKYICPVYSTSKALSQIRLHGKVM